QTLGAVVSRRQHVEQIQYRPFLQMLIAQSECGAVVRDQQDPIDSSASWKPSNHPGKRPHQLDIPLAQGIQKTRRHSFGNWPDVVFGRQRPLNAFWFVVDIDGEAASPLERLVKTLERLFDVRRMLQHAKTEDLVEEALSNRHVIEIGLHDQYIRQVAVV